ncbi:MAG: hypothetical protein EOP48_02525 [Sphingobacteriales bacterium]|nr:MAG: hypothetical protein EOP48_02525 [Sphingobacteriales bacterium]
MKTDQIILELMALEVYFEEGRRRCHSLRKELEQAAAYDSTIDEGSAPNRKLIEILNKRKSRFQKSQTN